MKKLLLILVSAFSIIIQSRAQQVFAPVGAEWNYIGNEHWYSHGAGIYYPEKCWNDHVISMKDTMVAGKFCRQLEIVRSYKIGAWNNNTDPDEIHTDNPTYLYVYNNSDTVFYYDVDSSFFQPLYIWNVTQNENVCLNHLDKIHHSFCYKVDSVIVKEYGTKSLRSYYTNAILSDSSGKFINWFRGFEYQPSDPDEEDAIQMTGLYIEKLGGVHGLFPSSVEFKIADAENPYGYPAGFLACYSDSSTHIKLVNVVCDFIPPPIFRLDIADMYAQNNEFHIFPNPGENYLNIELSNRKLSNTDVEISIYDVTGRIQFALLRKLNKSVEIDISQLPVGLYIIKIKGTNISYSQKIIKH